MSQKAASNFSEAHRSAAQQCPEQKAGQEPLLKARWGAVQANPVGRERRESTLGSQDTPRSAGQLGAAGQRVPGHGRAGSARRAGARRGPRGCCANPGHVPSLSPASLLCYTRRILPAPAPQGTLRGRNDLAGMVCKFKNAQSPSDPFARSRLSLRSVATGGRMGREGGAPWRGW